jgi:hypothetical protein
MAGRNAAGDDHWRTELATMPDFRERTRCYTLHLGLCLLFGHTVQGEEWMLSWLRRRCRKLLSE